MALPEIISIHIRKTGGISFRNILQQVYGDSLAADYGAQVSVEITENTRIIHGHITVEKYLQQYPEAKYITWLRDPIERLISQYFYYRFHFLNIEEEKLNPALLEFRENRITFNEFAHMPRYRNVMSSVLEGLLLKEFFFVGIAREFERGVKLLQQMLQWPPELQFVEWNTTRENIPDDRPELLREYEEFSLTDAERREIADFHQDDYELYQEGLTLQREGYFHKEKL